MTTQLRPLFSALALALSLSAVACDVPEDSERSASFELSSTEVAELLVDAGQVEQAEAVLEYEEAAASELELASPDAGPEQATTNLSLSDCFVQYCWEIDPSKPYSGQCINPNNAPMAGVCVLMSDVGPECAAFMWMGEYCSVI